MGSIEFPQLCSDLTRGLVNESIQALYLIWISAAAQRAGDRGKGTLFSSRSGI